MKNKFLLFVLITILGIELVACGQTTTTMHVSNEEYTSGTVAEETTEGTSESITDENVTEENPSNEIVTEETTEDTTKETEEETTTSTTEETKSACEKNGHLLTEANYQEAAKCKVCGATVGTPLTPNAVKEGLVMNGKMNTLYKYTAPCSTSKNHNTDAMLKFISYEVFSSDEEHEYKEGYEWHVAMVEITYKADENVKQYGYKCQMGIGNYYEGDFENDINYYGKIYKDYKIYNEYYDTGWLEDDTQITTMFIHARVPKNYDGLYVYFKNDNIPDEEETNRVYFRFDKSNTPLKSGDIKWGLKDDALYVWGNGAIPNGMINNNTVWWDYAITKLVITDGITGIGNDAFREMLNLKSVTMADSVKTIGESAFISCISLEEIKLSQKLETIGKAAFGQCFSLKKVALPNSLCKLGDGSFSVIGGGFDADGNWFEGEFTDMVISYKGKTYNNLTIQNVFK